MKVVSLGLVFANREQNGSDMGVYMGYTSKKMAENTWGGVIFFPDQWTYGTPFFWKPFS